jgi:hypothetical protein
VTEEKWSERRNLSTTEVSNARVEESIWTDKRVTFWHMGYDFDLPYGTLRRNVVGVTLQKYFCSTC